MVAKHSGDVEAVLVDKTLVAKLQARADHGILLSSLLSSPLPFFLFLFLSLPSLSSPTLFSSSSPSYHPSISTFSSSSPSLLLLTALVVDSSIVLTLVKDRRPVCVSLSPKRFSGAPASLTLSHTSSGRKLEKLSTFDPKVHDTNHSKVALFSGSSAPGCKHCNCEQHQS